jgi:S1-C subfamily serine protease
VSPRPPRRTLAAIGAALFTVLALLVGVGIGYGVWNGGTTPAVRTTPVLPGSGRTSPATVTSTQGSGKISSATGAPADVAAIARKVTPGLVDINTVLRYQTEEAAGTGMVLTPTGKVLTNNHVIEGSTSIKVTDLGNGRTYTASVVGYDKTVDVAVIQLKGASGLKTVTLGNSSNVKVGESIVGIGNAGGTGGTPSAAGGSVTALNQSITASDQGSLGVTTEHLSGLIETNADIQPGDSGGPLVTPSGQVVGMDTAASAAQGYSFRGAATGQGYSIPINAAIATAHQIMAGKATASVHIGGTAFLGVYIASPSSTRTTPASGGAFGGGRTPTATPATPATTSSTPSSGALVEGVIPNTPAAQVGLGQYDVITSLGGTTISTANALTKVMLAHKPGETVRVTWTTRTGQTHSAMVTLAAGPAE